MSVENKNQDKILYQIKRLGPQAAKLMADKLGITTMAVRQHLSQLESQGLVTTTEPVAQKRGRPVSAWTLTQSGHDRFPDAHAQITVELIASVREVLGENALEQVIKKRGMQIHLQYEKALSKITGVRGKTKELARLRTNEGYMADVEDIGKNRYLLIEHHCPICIAATSCEGFCRTELESFQQLLTPLASVERTEYLMDGARRCTYLITANT
jgi:predicted ArsR family transcriptional regulator